MESEESISKEVGYNPTVFKITYFVIYSFLIVFDITFLILYVMVWARLDVPLVDRVLYRFPGIFFMYLFFLILKISFESYEIVRIILFLVWGEQNKKGAYKVAEGFFGFKIFRMHYIVFIMAFVIWMEIGNTVMMFRTLDQPQYQFLSFYRLFQVILFIHIYSLEIAPRLLLLFADSTNKANRMRAIRNMIVWFFVLLFVFNINFIIYFIISIPRWRFQEEY